METSACPIKSTLGYLSLDNCKEVFTSQRGESVACMKVIRQNLCANMGNKIMSWAVLKTKQLNTQMEASPPPLRQVTCDVCC